MITKILLKNVGSCHYGPKKCWFHHDVDDSIKKCFEDEKVIERLANMIENLKQKDVNLDNRIGC